MEENIEVGGQKYRVGKKLPAMQQFHVSRRLGPALVVCGVTFKMMSEGVQVPLETWVTVAGPVMEVVSHMSDEDVEYVIFTCLKTCERLSGGSWAPVTTPDGKSLMFDDMGQAEMLRLTLAVLRENLANFARGMSAGDSSPQS